MPLLLQGRVLEDVQRLDLDTLEWALPPRVGAQPQGGFRGAGHTLAGLCAFGGCMPTVVGVLPVERTDLLLLGAAHQQPHPARISKRPSAKHLNVHQRMRLAVPGIRGISTLSSGTKLGAHRDCAGRKVHMPIVPALGDWALNIYHLPSHATQ